MHILGQFGWAKFPITPAWAFKQIVHANRGSHGLYWRMTLSMDINNN